MTNDYKTEIEKNGVIGFVPKGVSMWPFIKNCGQSVIIEKKSGRLKQFDVAFFIRKDGTYVLHRVIKVLENGYVMSGDSQLYTERIEEENVFGVLKGFYKGKKYIESDNKKYLKKVKRWYKHKLIRRIRLKIFYTKLRFKKKKVN